MSFFSDVSIIIEDFLMDAGVLAPLFSCIFIFLEGLLAFLPLFVFVTINVLSLGYIFGGILSWILTILGSFTTFYLCRKGFSSIFQKKIENKKKISKVMNVINNLSFTSLVIVIAMPFAPSFFINLGAGLSKISVKKYFLALLYGKIFVIIFLSYVGSNLIECLTNPLLIIRLLFILIVSYILARIVNKKFSIDERF